MKLKRLFTAILSAALTLSLCAMPAMADDTGTTAGTTPGTLTNGTPVWSKTKGSITIHKYEYNPTGTPQQGTGAAGEKAPEGAKALDGVTFHIYKVRDEDWLKAYYSGNDETGTGKDLSSNLDAKDYVDSVDPTTGAVTFKSSIDSTGFVDCYTFKTASGGTVTAGNLDFGLYLVVETSAPDKVTARADPFLVSVPMTRIADNDTTNKLTDWIYDVHVYPKNATTYASITISKSGYTGSRADGPLSNVEFVLEKATPATTAGGAETWNPVTKRDDNGVPYTLTTNGSGEIKIEGLSQGKYRIRENAYTTPNGYILDEANHEFTVNKNGEITYGSSAPSKSFTIQLENYRPDMEKKVYNGTDWAQDAQYGVGDTVPYQITIKVPKNIDKLTTFTVTDTPTGLKDDVNSIKIKDGATDLTKDTHYTVADDGNGFTITFTPSGMTAYAGKELVITYNAVVKDTAVVGKNGNLNKATLTYTNKINTHDSPTTSSTNAIEDSAVMYSFGIKVVKTKEDKSSPLEGVEFNLYKAMTEADATAHHYTTLSDDDATKYGLGVAGTGNVWACVKAGLKTDTNGVIDTSDSTSANYTHGLANGDYYLVETKTAEGYNLLTEPVYVKLDVTATPTWSSPDPYDSEGNLTKHGTVTDTAFTHNSGTGDTTKPALVVANIINRKGFTLPVTGGFGTLLFSGIGLLLVLVGVSVLFSLKKKNNRA